MPSDAAREAIRFILRSQEPTDYQLNRYIMSTQGPEAVRSVPAELRRLGLVERFPDGENEWCRWRLTAAGQEEAGR